MDSWPELPYVTSVGFHTVSRLSSNAFRTNVENDRDGAEDALGGAAEMRPRPGFFFPPVIETRDREGCH